MWEKYGKLFLTIALGIWATVSPLWFGDKHIDGDEWLVIITLGANILVVYIAPMRPSFRWTKSIANMILAGAAVAQTLAIDGYQPNDWGIIIAAALAVIGVTWAPAISPAKDGDPEVVVPSGLTTG